MLLNVVFNLRAGLLQSTILESVGCIWFNRSEAKDRETVARKYVLGERVYIVIL